MQRKLRIDTEAHKDSLVAEYTETAKRARADIHELRGLLATVRSASQVLSETVDLLESSQDSHTRAASEAVSAMR